MPMCSFQNVDGVLKLIAAVAEQDEHAKLQKRRVGRYKFTTRPGSNFIEVVTHDRHGVVTSRTAWTSDEFREFVEAVEETHRVSLQQPAK